MQESNIFLLKRSKVTPQVSLEMERITKLLYKEGYHKQGLTPYAEDPKWHAFQKRVGMILNAVHNSILQPFAKEALSDIGSDYNAALQFFRDHLQIDALLIRYGSTLLVFDKENLPPIILQMTEMINTGAVSPVHPDVREWLWANPGKHQELFPAPFDTSSFLVWIENNLFLFDLNAWYRSDVVDDKYINNWKLFNNQWQGWQR